MRNTLMILLIVLPLMLALLGGVIYLGVLLCRVMKTYLRSAAVRQEKKDVQQSLGAVLKAQRTRCNMTQAFVAESLGVSRQAVSKWENGTADPSTSNLIALAKLFQISPEELLRQTQQKDD